MSGTDPMLVAVNNVIADRAEDFQQWLAAVVLPAVRAQHPELEGRWQVLRSAEPEDGAVVFVFLFTGGSPADWDLRPLLENALGQDGAAAAFADFDGMLQQPQSGWWCQPVQLAEGPTGAVPAG
jgi:hypothetical protein